jgi:N-dimethylarginine dimethylaminohydrolase
MTTTWGVTSTVGELKRVLVRRPALAGDWLGAGWRVPDPVALARQHEHFVELLASLGCEVVVAPAVDGLVDAVYMYDSSFVIGSGAVVLRSPKPNRVAEADAAAEALTVAGVPVVGRLTGEAHADGGDLFFLEDGTLIAGRTYRTNAEGHRQLAALLAAEGRSMLRADMAHDRGPDVCLHLMSVVSPIHEHLAVVFEPLAPVPLLEALAERGVRWIAVDEADYLAMGTNVLAVRPGVVVMVEGSPTTRRALEREGVEVHGFDGSELCHKGDGGPTCLTRPLWRA